MSKTVRAPAYRKTARYRNPLTGAEIMGKSHAHRQTRHAARQEVKQELRQENYNV